MMNIHRQPAIPNRPSQSFISVDDIGDITMTPTMEKERNSA